MLRDAARLGHASARITDGHKPKVVSQRLGHATISVTPGIYPHAIPALQEEAAALIAGLVFSGAQPD